mgnify:CR=1 FL=1|jgi:hypothetical protein
MSKKSFLVVYGAWARSKEPRQIYEFGKLLRWLVKTSMICIETKMSTFPLLTKGELVRLNMQLEVCADSER